VERDEHEPLEPGVVHLWRIDLTWHAADMHAVLNAAEGARAARFVTSQLRNRWTASRAALRCILAGYTRVAPRELEFCEGSHGKPALPGGPRFNLAHTGDLALLAVTAGGEVGVDLERVRTLPDLMPVARLVFSADELAYLAARHGDDRRVAFFTLWTRKEAYIKATGEGMSAPLQEITILVDGSAHPVVRRHGDPSEGRRWSVLDLAIDQGYAAALAVEGPVQSVERREYDPT
jgi:4'-phosphopantetheinyl transferase